MESSVSDITPARNVYCSTILQIGSISFHSFLMFLVNSKSSEALSVKATKDVLKNDKIKEKLKKMSEDAKKSGLKNVTSNTDFAKFNKGKATYDSLSRVLFFDSETKIGMFRDVCGLGRSVRVVTGGLNLAGNMIKQKLHIKNQTYDVTCVFISKDGDKLVFKTLCSIKIG